MNIQTKNPPWLKTNEDFSHLASRSNVISGGFQLVELFQDSGIQTSGLPHLMWQHLNS